MNLAEIRQGSSGARLFVSEAEVFTHEYGLCMKTLDDDPRNKLLGREERKMLVERQNEDTLRASLIQQANAFFQAAD